MKKKKIIVITFIGIVLLGLLVWYLRKPNDNSETPSIDTGEIKETTLKWEDVVDVDISGFEGDLIANISYKKIPELQEKIEVEEEKWNQVRDKLDPNNDASTIESYLNWLGEIRKPYNENFCELPADLNAKKKGDIVKISCNSETLKKLNYKFNDGFEITLSDIIPIEEKVEYTETNESIVDNNKNTNNETNVVNTDDGTKKSFITEEGTKVIIENYYSTVGNHLFIHVNDIDTVNLNQTRTDGFTITVIVKNDDDFNAVKEHALKRGNIDYIEYGDQVYMKETDFKESLEWQGRVG